MNKNYTLLYNGENSAAGAKANLPLSQNIDNFKTIIIVVQNDSYRDWYDSCSISVTWIKSHHGKHIRSVGVDQKNCDFSFPDTTHISYAGYNIVSQVYGI